MLPAVLLLVALPALTSYNARLPRADLACGDCLAETTYAICKPRGVLSATRPPPGEPQRRTLTDLMIDAGVAPLPGHVGRLDADTSGLILVTAHSLLNRALINMPGVSEAYGGQTVTKTYSLLLAGRHEADSERLGRLAEPFEHQRAGRTFYSQPAVRVDFCEHVDRRLEARSSDGGGGTVQASPGALAKKEWHQQRRAARWAAAREADPSFGGFGGFVPEDDNWLTRVEVTLAQGRHHQVRRLCKRAQLKLVALRRIAIGPLSLDSLGLPVGGLRVLDRGEKRALYELCLPRLLAEQDTFHCHAAAGVILGAAEGHA